MHGAPQNWKLVLAYDGTDFHGWQMQRDTTTVQGTLAEALNRITGEQVLPQGSGRTDAGVHAVGQVASFPLLASIPPENLQRALNRILPASIRVLHAETVAAEFHARFSARYKTYEYRLYQGAVCAPAMARYVHACPWKLDLHAMCSAAQLVVGEHDFTSFAATDPDATARNTGPPSQPKSMMREIKASEWREGAIHDTEDHLLVYRVRGNGFLHHMVRNLVGTFIDVGRGRIAPDAVGQILAARDRSAAGPTAPPQGLFLISVDYEGSTA
jgi:tRNA pseudouridine38-40 synthase